MENKGKKEHKSLIRKIKDFFNAHKTFAEICRFIIVGGIATLIDFLVMGFTEFFIERAKYESVLNIFFNSPNLNTSTVVIGTAVGFVVGLIFNYIFSIIFVYTEKGNSKSVKGFVVFTILSVIGLGLNMGGMFLLYDKLHINQWVAKVFVTCVVLGYNYITRKIFVFSKKNVKQNDIVLQNTETDNSETDNTEINKIDSDKEIN